MPMVIGKPAYSCFECNKRHLGCHSTCTSYANEKAKAMEYQQIKANHLFYEAVYKKYVSNKKGAKK